MSIIAIEYPKILIETVINKLINNKLTSFHLVLTNCKQPLFLHNLTSVTLQFT